jgi:hypothetical protein
MEFEPKYLEFRDIRLNQAYTTSLCITNTYQSTVDFTLEPSSSRFAVNPSRVNLSSGQSIVVTVKLFLNHIPNISDGVGQHGDSIRVVSSYFEHVVNLTYSLHSKETGAHPITSTLRHRIPAAHPQIPRSSSLSSIQNAVAADVSDSSSSKVTDLETKLSAKVKTIEQLECIIEQLESKFPSIQEVVRNRVEQERLVFEDKSVKVANNNIYRAYILYHARTVT